MLRVKQRQRSICISLYSNYKEILSFATFK